MNMEFQGNVGATAANIVVLSTVILLVVSLRWSWKFVGGGNRSPPEPRGSWPVMIHLPLLGAGEPAHRTLAKLADEYGPIFKIRLGVHRAVVVSSWEIAKECLTTHDKVLSNRPRTCAFEILGYNFALLGFAPYGPYWREVRKIATLELLSNRRIEMLKHVRTAEVRAFVRQIYDLYCSESDQIGGGKALVDMKQWFRDLNMSSILRLVVGLSLNDITNEQERDRYHKAIVDFFQLLGTFIVSDAFPFLRWLDIGGYGKAMKRVAKELDFFHQRWLEDHKNRRVSGELMEHEQDFMDVILEIFDKVDARPSGHDTDTIIKATSMAMISGGVDTISVTLTWTLSLLLNNPHTLKKAQEELDSHVGKDRNVNESDIEGLVYLQAVLKESMRLYPAAPLSVPREAISDTIVNGYDIPAGTWLFVNLYKIHRDPTVWSDACEFRPERFLVHHKDVDVRGQNFEYIPFGSGRRICPGISYALQTSALILATLLHSFDLGSPANEPVDMVEEPGLTCSKATPLELFVAPRLSHHLY